MTDTFTPGPWHEDHISDRFINIRNSAGADVVFVSRTRYEGKEEKDGWTRDKYTPVPNAAANARLIAAAPELLGALRNLAIWLDNDHPEHDAFCEAEADHAAALDEFPSSSKVSARLVREALAIIEKATGTGNAMQEAAE